MKRQRLSALEIGVLANEIDRLIAGKIINEIRHKSDGIYFFIEDICLGFKIVAGSPYFINCPETPNGRPWLTRIFGGRIEKVSQVNYDRLIIFEISLLDRLGQKKLARLYFEFYKSGNIVFTDDKNTVQGSFRDTLSNAISEEYSIPKTPGFSILSCADNHVLTEEELGQIKAHNLLQYADIEKLTGQDVLRLIKESQTKPSPHLVISVDGAIRGFSIYGPPYKDSLSGKATESLLQAATLYIQAETPSESESRHAPDTGKLLKKALAKINSIQDELAEAENFGRYRQYGEIILANMHNIQKGESSVRRVNPYSVTHDYIEIALDQALTPEKNANSYFEKARKFEDSIKILKSRLTKQKTEIERLHKLADTPMESFDTLTTLPGSPKKQMVSLPFRQFKLANGWEVYVGKSAMANDELTFSFSKKDDFWFHAWQAAGSHVLLRRPHKGDIPDKQTLLKAASMAAYYSKARSSGKVPVIYTEVRYVRKIKGAAGKVSVTSEKQLMVIPMEPDKLIT